MLIWFIFAIGSALLNSLGQTLQKWVLVVTPYSKATIAFVATVTGALILLAVSFFVVGLPPIDRMFWIAILVSGLVNCLAWPLMLRAYQLGEFSSVYSMTLLTPVFLFGTSLLFLGERPSLIGAAGVLLTVFGLWIMTRRPGVTGGKDFKKANWLGVAVAFLWSISTNFDKLAAVHSDRFLGSAGVLSVVAIGSGLYLLLTQRTLIARSAVPDPAAASHRFPLPFFTLLLLMGISISVSSVFHASALLAGFVSYTLAVKRLGILFGLLWGWLFFHEKDLGRKFVGALIAVAGVAAIFLS